MGGPLRGTSVWSQRRAFRSGQFFSSLARPVVRVPATCLRFTLDFWLLARHVGLGPSDVPAVPRQNALVQDARCVSGMCAALEGSLWGFHDLLKHHPFFMMSQVRKLGSLPARLC